MNYAFFSYVYDTLMDDTLYGKWLEYADGYLERSGQHVLELACGTGELAIRLQKAGYQVTGLDLSDEMLSLAMNRQLEAGIRFPLIQGDMRQLEEVGNFEAVTCFSDSLCYMRDENEVLEVFKSVYHTLEEGGVFLFDVHSTHKIDNLFPGYMYNAELDDVVFLWTSYAGEEPHTVEHDLSFFIEEEDGRYRRYDETHRERTYSISTYTNLLKEAGFQHVDVTGDFGRSGIEDTTERWFFACKK